MDVRLQVKVDGETQNVSLDTVDPNNSIPVPVTLSGGIGSITANQGDPNTIGNAWPVKPTDGTNSQEFTVGGAAKVDGSDVVQPVSQSGLWNIEDITGTVSLPTGAATESAVAELGLKLDDVNSNLNTINGSVENVVAEIIDVNNSIGEVNNNLVIINNTLIDNLESINSNVSSTASNTGQMNAKLPATLGAKTIANSMAVNIASDQTVPVSLASQPLPTGAATESTLSAMSAKLPTTLGQKAMTASLAVVLASDQASVPVAASQSGTWTVQPGNTANTTAWLVTQDKAASSSVTSVSGSASSVSLLVSNSARKNASFYNDSSAVLYLKLGSTASTSSYTVQVPASGYYELPVGRIYTGAIDGIWASATGAVRITELS